MGNESGNLNWRIPQHRAISKRLLPVLAILAAVQAAAGQEGAVLRQAPPELLAAAVPEEPDWDRDLVLRQVREEERRAAIEAVREGRIRIVPERFTKVYYNWMENIRDWCISRQLWWGHRIPVWYCQECGETIVAKEDPTQCHRRLLVGRVLGQAGTQLMHIRGDGRVQSEEEVAEEERFRKTGGQLTLFEMEEAEEWKSTQSVLPRKARRSSSQSSDEPESGA